MLFFNKILFGIFSDKILDSLQSRDHRFYGLEPSFTEVYYPTTVPVWFFMQRIMWDPLPQLQCFQNFFHAMGHGSKQMVIWWPRSGPYAGYGSSMIPPNSCIFVMVIRAVWGLAFSCCNSLPLSSKQSNINFRNLNTLKFSEEFTTQETMIWMKK